MLEGNTLDEIPTLGGFIILKNQHGWLGKLRAEREMSEVHIDHSSFGVLQVHIPVNLPHLPMSGSILVWVMVRTNMSWIIIEQS